MWSCSRRRPQRAPSSPAARVGLRVVIRHHRWLVVVEAAATAVSPHLPVPPASAVVASSIHVRTVAVIRQPRGDGCPAASLFAILVASITASTRLVLSIYSGCVLQATTPLSWSASVTAASGTSSGQQQGLICANCGVVHSSQWRRNYAGLNVCNACGLYYSRYKVGDRVLLQGRVLSGPRGCQKQAAGPPSTVHGETGGSSRSSSGGGSSQSAAANQQRCSNCGTGVTTMWRRNAEGEPVCNACGLYYKLHKVGGPSLTTPVLLLHSTASSSFSPSTLL